MVWCRERLYQTGLGARAMADLGEGRGSTGSPTARDDVQGRWGMVWYWELLHQTGLGALAMADIRAALAKGGLRA